MGLLIDGKWRDQWYDTESNGGRFEAMGKAQLMATALAEFLPVSQAARVAAKLNGVSRRELYQLLED